MIVNSDDLLLSANRAFYEASGLSEPSIGGQPLFEVLHSDGDWKSCADCKERLKAIEPQLDSSAGELQTYSHEIRSIKGDSRGAAMVVRDLTTLSPSEPVDRATALLQHFVDAAYDAVYATDLEGRFLWANKRAERVWELCFHSSLFRVW